MAIDASIFPLEDLVLDRLYANLVESEDTVQLLETLVGSSRSDWTAEQLSQYEARLGEEEDKVELLKKLISLKRQEEMEKL